MCARFAEDQHETGDENQNIVRGSDPYLSEDVSPSPGLCPVSIIELNVARKMIPENIVRMSQERLSSRVLYDVAVLSQNPHYANQRQEPTRKYNNGEWLWLKKSWTGLFMEMRVYVTNAQLSNNVWTYQLQDERGAAPPDRNGERTLVPERYLKRNN